MKGQMGRDLLGPEGAGIFLFVEELDPAHPNTVVIEVELLGVIDGVADLDPLADIGGGGRAPLKLMVASLLTTRSWRMRKISSSSARESLRIRTRPTEAL